MLTVVGNTSIDVFVRGVAHMPGAAGMNGGFPLVKTAEPVVTTIGGAGGVTAYVAAALGEAVRLWSSVGSDAMGALALDWLEGRHVDTTSVRITSEVGTSTNVLIFGDGRETGIVHYQGAAGTFAPRIRAIGGGGTDWIMIAGYSQLPNWRGENTVELLRNARRSGLNTALDPGAGPEEHATQQELEVLLPFVGMLFVDETELERITGSKVAEAVRWALEAGVRTVIVRRALHGVSLFEKEGSQDGARVEGPDFEVATAAVWGDSFNAGLLYALVRNKTLEESARFGLSVAAHVARARRGVLEAPSEADIRSVLNLGPNPLGEE